MGRSANLYPEMLNDQKPLFLWTPAMLFNKFATREYLENRRVLRLWKKSIEIAKTKKTKMKERILVRRSRQHYMKTLPARPHRIEKYRLRNERLFLEWSDVVDMSQFKTSRRLIRQWRLSIKGVKRFLKTVEFLNKLNNKQLVLNWTQDIKNLSKMKFVVVHKSKIHRDSQMTLEHFLSENWYLAVVQPYQQPNNQTCIIRNMETSQLETYSVEDLLPAENLPKFGVKNRRQMVKQRHESVRDAFQRSLRFVMLHNSNDLDTETLRSFLCIERKKLLKRESQNRRVN